MVLVPLDAALPTPVEEGDESRISSIQFLESVSERGTNAIACVVYSVVKWIKEGKISGMVPRGPPGQPRPPGSTGPMGPKGLPAP